jgi:hypothetical protein
MIFFSIRKCWLTLFGYLLKTIVVYSSTLQLKVCFKNGAPIFLQFDFYLISNIKICLGISFIFLVFTFQFFIQYLLLVEVKLMLVHLQYMDMANLSQIYVTIELHV